MVRPADAVLGEGRGQVPQGGLVRLPLPELPTGIHRVAAPPDREEGRLSVVQFCHPTPSTILMPLASCITPAHPQRFGAISAADRLDEVLWQIGLTGGGGGSAR